MVGTLSAIDCDFGCGGLGDGYWRYKVVVKLWVLNARFLNRVGKTL